MQGCFVQTDVSSYYQVNTLHDNGNCPIGRGHDDDDDDDSGFHKFIKSAYCNSTRVNSKLLVIRAIGGLYYLHELGSLCLAACLCLPGHTRCMHSSACLIILWELHFIKT